VQVSQQSQVGLDLHSRDAQFESLQGCQLSWYFGEFPHSLQANSGIVSYIGHNQLLINTLQSLNHLSLYSRYGRLN
jgi:hypothetical protein